MAFNDLETTEMVSLFSPIVSTGTVKTQFLSIPEVAGLHKQVVTAYEGVLSVRPDPTGDPELQRIAEHQKGVDYRHDRLARSVALFLEAQRERALGENPPNEERAAECDAAVAEILPTGTAIIIASYRAEAGNTQRIERLLGQPEGKDATAVLKSIPVQKGESALDTVKLWIEAGAELDKLENQKAARLAALQSAPAPAQRVIQGARSQWITIATLLVQNLSVSSAPEETKNAIRHPLLDAAQRAGKRSGRRATTPQGEPAPVAPTGPAPTGDAPTG